MKRIILFTIYILSVILIMAAAYDNPKAYPITAFLIGFGGWGAWSIIKKGEKHKK